MTTENPRAFIVEGFTGDSTEGTPAFAAYSPTLDTARDDVRAYRKDRTDVRLWQITENATGDTETLIVRDPIVTSGRRGVDLTPTWTALLPAYFAVLEDGTDEGKRIAREELRRMAQAADYWNEHAKAEGLPTDSEAA